MGMLRITLGITPGRGVVSCVVGSPGPPGPLSQRPLRLQTLGGLSRTSKPPGDPGVGNRGQGILAPITRSRLPVVAALDVGGSGRIRVSRTVGRATRRGQSPTTRWVWGRLAAGGSDLSAGGTVERRPSPPSSSCKRFAFRPCHTLLVKSVHARLMPAREG